MRASDFIPRQPPFFVPFGMSGYLRLRNCL
jgi:hypothetical protein